MPKLNLLALGLILLSLPVAAQQRDPKLDTPPQMQPRTESECRAFALQRSNEEFLAQDSSIRRNPAFQSGPGAIRDPFSDSQRLQANIDRAGREQELYNVCLEWLRRQQ
jgi:hypothetical protein